MITYPKRLLWLDDVRSPFSESFSTNWLAKIAPEFQDWKQQGQQIVWAKSYEDFTLAVRYDETPFDLVCFDHDLGEENTGLDAAKFLVEIYQQTGKKLPVCRVHSANPVGKERINAFLKDNNILNFFKEITYFY